MNLMLLADGTVMAIGGTASGDSEAAAVLAGEIWNPTTETWSTVESMGEARMYHSSAVLLADGRVVVGGGEAGGRLRAQVYSPPYLFKGTRPVISGAPGSAAYGTTIQVTSPDAASITSVALLRPPASTHAFDMNQRYVPLNFTRSGTTLNATGPASGGVAPPGDYMLIIKNASGVPSVARFVRIGTSGGLQPGTVAGRVTDSVTHAAIQGATVASSAGNDTTDSQGRYSIGGAPAGELQLTFSKGGYATETQSALITGGETTTLDVELAPPGGVAGRVTDCVDGRPHRGRHGHLSGWRDDHGRLGRLPDQRRAGRIAGRVVQRARLCQRHPHGHRPRRRRRRPGTSPLPRRPPSSAARSATWPRTRSSSGPRSPSSRPERRRRRTPSVGITSTCRPATTP